jgi:DNA-binding response OmpR family regulator
MNANTQILIVDDEETIRKILKALLVKEGFQVVVADNGKSI